MSLCKVRDVAFVRFSAPDLDAMATFLTEFGLRPALGDDGVLYARGFGPSPYLHVTQHGDPAFLGVAFEAAHDSDLDVVARAENVAVQPLAGPGGGRVVRLTDPDGFSVELVTGRAPVRVIETRPPDPFNTADMRARINALKRVGHGPSHVRRIGHCVLNVTDFRASETWYKDHFGFITSDEIDAPPGAPPGAAIGAFMRCDRGTQPTDHHSLFLLGTGTPAYNHAAFEVLDFDDLMRGNAHLGAASREHDWGVGRHYLGSQIFDYWRDPWGHAVEHWTDGDQLDAAWGSRRASLQELLGVQWGPSFPHPVDGV